LPFGLPQAVAETSAPEIFRGYVRLMGVGAIATAGIFGNQVARLPPDLASRLKIILDNPEG